MSGTFSKGEGSRTRRPWLATDVWPYLMGFAILLAMLIICRPFWLTNDDAQMSLIADGQGLAGVPSPHLVLTNIVWGYLVYWFPDIGGIRSYAWITYAAFALAYVAMVLAFRRCKVDHRMAAAALVLVYVPALIHPQFTLVAGYLAAAGLLVACTAIHMRSQPLAAFAGVLVVVSSLVRMDETVLVMLISAPLCIASLRDAWASDLRIRWLAIAGVSAALVAGFWFLDYLEFAASPWAYFASGYGLRDGFSDFGLGMWFNDHPAHLAGGPLSINDLHLLEDWFCLDTQVCSPAALHHLLESLPWQGRIHVDHLTFVRALEPFTNTLVSPLCVVLAALLLLQRRRRALFAALALFAIVMVGLAMAGRPGVTRIYWPAFVALTLLGVIRFDETRRPSRLLFLVVICAAAGFVCGRIYVNDRHLVGNAGVVQAATCGLTREKLTLVWGGRYPFQLEYPVFQPKQYDCPFDYYPFGQFSLAPYALDHLHSFTGGKDFVPALLAGQSFRLIADHYQLQMLTDYVRGHYGTKLDVTVGPSNPFFNTYTIVIASHDKSRAPRLR
jgi:hypothetical protein